MRIIQTMFSAYRRMFIFTLAIVITGAVTLGLVSMKNQLGFTSQPPQYPSDYMCVIPDNTTNRVFYNRVPKCGSSLTMTIFRQLAARHKWHYPADRTLRIMENPSIKNEEWAEVYWTESQDAFRRISSLIASHASPMLYSMHVHYFNTTRFSSKAEPLFINVIRDPLERRISWYYYIRYAKGNERIMSARRRNMTFDDCVSSNNPECTAPDPSGFFALVPFFCGHDDICRYPNPTALRRAQYHVSRYLVVGLLEHYEDFLIVIESLLPSYFKGATAMYKGLQNLEELSLSIRVLKPLAASRLRALVECCIDR